MHTWPTLQHNVLAVINRKSKMEESWLCTSDRGQESFAKTFLAGFNNVLIIWPNRKKMDLST